jgi:hypothetical protein
MSEETPVVSKNTAQPSKSVQIVIQNTPEVKEGISDAETPIDPNAPDERAELIPQDNWQTSPMFYELANFLGVPEGQYEANAEQISVITDYAIEHANSNKIEDIMHTIRELEGKLQPPPWGEKRVTNIYRALRMEARYNSAKKAMGAFSRTGKWDE